MLKPTKIGSTTLRPKEWPWPSSNTRRICVLKGTKTTKPPTVRACLISSSTSNEIWRFVQRLTILTRFCSSPNVSLNSRRTLDSEQLTPRPCGWAGTALEHRTPSSPSTMYSHEVGAQRHWSLLLNRQQAVPCRQNFNPICQDFLRKPSCKSVCHRTT